MDPWLVPRRDDQLCVFLYMAPAPMLLFCTLLDIFNNWLYNLCGTKHNFMNHISTADYGRRSQVLKLVSS